MYTLHLRDAKTRERQWIPDDRVARAGRLQLYIYFTLLENLLTREPPFDFNILWRKLDVEPDAKLPTQFLVQAHLISGNEDVELISLSDLATSFYELIRNETMHVSPLLELVYYHRPSSKNPKGKGVEPQKDLPAVTAGLPARNEGGTSRQPDIAQLEHYADRDIVSTKGVPLSRRKSIRS
jgi:hypothetical protein